MQQTLSQGSHTPCVLPIEAFASGFKWNQAINKPLRTDQNGFPTTRITDQQNFGRQKGGVATICL